MLAIIDWFPFYTLKVVVRVSKFFHIHAGRRLWKSCSITIWDPSTTGRLEDGLDFVAKHATHVRRLSLGLYSALATPKHPHVLRKLSETLASLTALKSLEIAVHSSKSAGEILQALSVGVFAPDLAEFSTDLDVADLVPFWSTHPLISHVMVGTHSRKPHRATTDPIPLPSLASVHVKSPLASVVIRGNPVTFVDISCGPMSNLGSAANAPETFMSNMFLSTAPITRLNMNIADDESSIKWYTIVIANLPHLRYLNTYHSTSFMTQPERRARVIEVLGSLAFLEELTWGIIKPPDLAALMEATSVSSRQFQALRVAMTTTVIMPGTWRENRYTRQDTSQAWSK